MIRQVEAIKMYPQHLINVWFEQLRRDLIRLTDCWQEQYFDYNLGDTCTAYSHCPYIPLCTSSMPQNWYGSYEVTRWNPLLRNPSAAAEPASTGDGTEADTNPS